MDPVAIGIIALIVLVFVVVLVLGLRNNWRDIHPAWKALFAKLRRHRLIANDNNQ